HEPALSQRDQYHSRLHEDLDVSEAVGGDRGQVFAADRKADRSRHRALAESRGAARERDEVVRTGAQFILRSGATKDQWRHSEQSFERRGATADPSLRSG